MKFSVVGAAKFITSAVVGIGTGKIVGQIIKTHIQPTSAIDKVAVVAATWVIGAIATEATKKYTDDAIDNIAETVTSVIEKVKTKQKIDRINSGQSTFDAEDLDPKKYQKNDNNVWVFKDADEEIEFEEVIGMIRSGQWFYNADENYWFRKDGGGKKTDFFRQLVEESDTTVKWVWFKK